MILILCLLLGSLAVPHCAFRSKLHSFSQFNTFKQRLRCIAKGDVNAVPDSKRRLSDVTLRLEENMSPNVVNYPRLLGSLHDLELTTSQPNFWEEPETAQAVVAEQNKVKAMVGRIDSWKSTIEDIRSLIDIAAQEDAQTRSAFETFAFPITHNTILKP